MKVHVERSPQLFMMYAGHWSWHVLIGNLTSTSVMSVMCSSEIVLRRWRTWIHNKLPPPSWASSRGEHLHEFAEVEGTHTVIPLTCGEDQITFIIVCGISCRGDFGVQFDSNNSTSAFQLLQETCIHMSRFSHSIMQKKASAAKQSEQQLCQRFVYSRFMWGKCGWKEYWVWVS